MNTDERIEYALKALTARDAALEAPPCVEQRLREAFRRRHARSAWRRAMPWVIAAAAAALILVAMRPSSSVPVLEKTVGRAPSPAASLLAGPLAVSSATRGSRADQGVRPTLPRRKPQPAPEPTETATEFFPLLDIAPPFESGELVRVTLPAAAMRRVGIPVREEHLMEPVDADILIGQEGLAHAIRFVKFDH